QRCVNPISLARKNCSGGSQRSTSNPEFERRSCILGISWGFRRSKAFSADFAGIPPLRERWLAPLVHAPSYNKVCQQLALPGGLLPENQQSLPLSTNRFRPICR